MAQNYFPSFTFPSSLEHTPSFSTGTALSLHLGRAGQGREGLLPHFFFYLPSQGSGNYPPSFLTQIKRYLLPKCYIPDAAAF